jgi:predicted DNA-binding transcriptional regulator AlpA
MAAQRFWRMADLIAAGILPSTTTAYRWIGEGKFPRPVSLGPNVRAWPDDVIQAHLRSLQTEGADHAA